MKDLPTNYLTLQGVTFEGRTVYFIPQEYYVVDVSGKPMLVLANRDLYYEPVKEDSHA